MNSFFNKLKRKNTSDRGSFGSNSSLFSSGILSLSPYTVNEKQLPSFLKAVWKNDLTKVKKLMKKNYNQVDSENRTGFHLACAAGHLDIIKELISNYCNEILEKRDINSKTGLYKAVEKGIYENVQYILEKGARIDVKDDRGESLIHAAVRYKHENVLQYLLHKEITPNETNRDGDTALHLAAELDFVGGLEILLKYPCDIDCKNHKGKTPLIIASESGNQNSVKLLLSNCADQTVCDNEGFNALYHATFHQRMECMSLLQETEDFKSVASSQKPQFTMEAPEFLATIPSISRQSNESSKVNEISQNIPTRSRTSKAENQFRAKNDSKEKKSNSQESVHSNSSWMGDFTNTSSEATIPASLKSTAIHDISTPSSMPNPSDIVISTSKSILNGVHNLPRKKQVSEDEESQWSDYEKSHHTGSQYALESPVKTQIEKVENKVEVNSHKQSASDSEWDSDDTEQQGIQVDLSTIDEESAGKRSRINSLQTNHHHEREGSELSFLMPSNHGDDGHQTDSNIEECYNTNYIVTNPPINYDNIDDRSIEDDSDFDVLNELCTTQISNINYKDKSTFPSSKPPKSPSTNTLEKNIPTITVEDSTPKRRDKHANLAGGDNLSYSSTEFDINSRSGSLRESDSLNDFQKLNLKSIDDYIKKCSHLESKCRSLESERDSLLLNLNSIKEIKEKWDSEKSKMKLENQKLEAKLTEKLDELSDFQSRFKGAEESLSKREKELFEIQKAKQEVEDKYNQIEIDNITANSKIKKLQQEVEHLLSENTKVHNHQGDSQQSRVKQEEELKDLVKSNDELKDQISKLQQQISRADIESTSMTTEHKLNILNFEKQINNLKETVEKECEDKNSLQEEIDQLRKTIKNLNCDLESSNRSVALTTKQERENSELKDRVQEMQKNYSQLSSENENLTKSLADIKAKMNNLQIETKKLENELKIKDDKISKLEIQYKTYESQASELEKLLERKNVELRECENKLINTEVELKKEMKIKGNNLEIIDEIIKTVISDYPGSPEIVKKLQTIKNSINNDETSKIGSFSPKKSSNYEIDLSIELSKSRSQIRVLQDQIDQMKNSQINSSMKQQSNYPNETTIEMERVDRLEQMGNEIHKELQSKSRIIQNHQQSMELTQLTTKAAVFEENRDTLIQQNKTLNETLVKERQLKDALTEQLIHLVKASHVSNPQIYGNEPPFFSTNGFPNSLSQLNIPISIADSDRKGYANSMLNLSVVKSIGVEDEDLRQKLRHELDRSIAKHLESGKPIRQLNIKDKIRSLNIGRYPASKVAWKSP